MTSTITPTTNPTSTIICNTIAMLSAGNSIVFNVHPNAKNVSAFTIRLINQAIVAAGGEALAHTCNAGDLGQIESLINVVKDECGRLDILMVPVDGSMTLSIGGMAIIAHRRENWRDTTPESVVECLESLRQLALADSE